MAKLGSQGVGGSAEKCGEIPLKPPLGGSLVRFETRLLERQRHVLALALAGFFRGPSHTGFSLSLHAGNSEINGATGQR
jgi:hypothetical protein